MFELVTLSVVDHDLSIIDDQFRSNLGLWEKEGVSHSKNTNSNEEVQDEEMVLHFIDCFLGSFLHTLKSFLLSCVVLFVTF